MNILFVTKNKHKLAELSQMCQAHSGPKLHDLSQLNRDIHWQEVGQTFFDNALIKARAAKDSVDCGVLADDSGLVVRALKGDPGIFSSRYAGPDATDEENYTKLLDELEGETNRRAMFVTCLVYIDAKSKEHAFYGVLPGTITSSPMGVHGFGYDPVFIPQNYEMTLAELHPDVKNQLSHRFRAYSKWLRFLNLV